MQKFIYAGSLYRFRVIAAMEGMSFLLLLFIAMPLKYFAGYPNAVLIVGWMHGILFMAYMLALLHVKLTYMWNVKKVFLAIFASVVPFGPFIFEKYLMNK